MKETWTGGCQCGAVRYELLQKPDGAHICHCRMCQKAFGNFFAALAGVPRDKFRVTRGTVSNFKSSADVQRGFCRECGTPLTAAPPPSRSSPTSARRTPTSPSGPAR